MPKPINRDFEMLGLKSLSIFDEQTTMLRKLTIEKVLGRQIGRTVEQIWQIIVHADWKPTIGAICQQETSKILLSWSNQF